MLLNSNSFLALFVAWASFVNGDEDFSYSDLTKWPDLCKNGGAQSPIDLKQNLDKQNLDTLNKVYYVDPKQQTLLTNVLWANSKTTFKDLSFGMDHWALNFNISSSSPQSINSKQNYELKYADHLYPLKGFHFHTPSEHYINGEKADLELHFVHKDDQGNIAVVGILFKVSTKDGNTDNFFKTVTRNLPGQKQDETRHILNSLSLQSTFDSLFTKSPFYQYQGSLTTPPCSENVAWTVSSNILNVNSKYFKLIKHLLGENARPIQRTNTGTANNKGGNSNYFSSPSKDQTKTGSPGNPSSPNNQNTITGSPGNPSSPNNQNTITGSPGNPLSTNSGNTKLESSKSPLKNSGK